MPRRQKPSPFDVKLSTEERRVLAEELSRAVTDAINARAMMIQDGGLIDLYDWFYEQGRSDPKDRPFVGAADLTSYIFTENVDALRSRMMQAVFKAEPFCIVDGWGQSAQRAAFVEAFHEWQVDEEGLEEELGKVCHGALLEDAYVLEVRERVETRKIVEEMDVALVLSERGVPILDEKGDPQLMADEAGEPIEAQPGQPSARITRTYTKTRRLGPEYDAISMKDFVFLPGHAKNMRQVWGYAKRTWERVPTLRERVEDGIYDQAAVEAVGEQSDRQDGETPRTVVEIAHQEGAAVEKELWELSLYRDLDGDGREEWYVLTLSTKHREILRLKIDKFVQKIGRPRCVPFVLFPRRNSVYGYSYAGDKLLTLAEEHTALRNMAADRSALATNAPITQLAGGLWDPDAQPFGIGEVIQVRSHDEIKQFQVTDVPQSVIYLLRDVMAAKERVGGLADTAIGVQSEERRTLGENQMVATGSAVRVEEPLGYFRKAISAVMQLRHAIWLETLEADERGLEAPAHVVDRLQVGGQALQGGRFTADLLRGRFRFKPYGSVDTADAGVRLQYFNQGLIALANLAKIMPALAAIFMDPDVVLRTIQEWARVYKVRDVNVFLRALQKAQMAQMQPGAGMLPQAGGMAPGDPVAPNQGQMPPEIAGLLSMLQGGGQGGGAPFAN